MEGLNGPISLSELPTLFENDIVSRVRAHEPSVELKFLPCKPRGYFSAHSSAGFAATDDVPHNPRR